MHQRWGCNRTFPPFLVFRCHQGIASLLSCPFLDVIFPLLFLSSLLFAPFTASCRIVFAMPKDLWMWPYHLSFRLFTMVRRSSCTPSVAHLYNTNCTWEMKYWKINRLWVCILFTFSYSVGNRTFQTLYILLYHKLYGPLLLMSEGEGDMRRRFTQYMFFFREGGFGVPLPENVKNLECRSHLTPFYIIIMPHTHTHTHTHTHQPNVRGGAYCF